MRAATRPLLSPPAKTITLRAHARASKAFLWIDVEPGDTLAGLGWRYGVTPHDIKVASGIRSDALALGQTLRVPIVARPQREPRLPPGARLHEVQSGESLTSIEARYGISELDLVSANPDLPSLDHLAAGTELVIPTRSRGYVVEVKAGQSLASIADDFNLDLHDVARANRVSDPREIREGDFVLLPGVAARGTLATLEKKRAAELAALERARQLAEQQRLARLEAQRKAAEAAAAASARAAAERRAALRAQQRASVARVTRASANYRPPAYSPGEGGYAWPMRHFTLSSGYGRRGFWISGSNFHTGIDMAAPYGTPIYAAHAGTVIEAGYGTFGLNVRIATGNGVTNIYGHMSRTVAYAGETVNRGQLIGYVGCSGICTGPHLHFEVQVGGEHRNPYDYLP